MANIAVVKREKAERLENVLLQVNKNGYKLEFRMQLEVQFKKNYQMFYIRQKL